MILRLTDVAVLLAEPSQFDLWIRIRRLPLGPGLELGHRLIPAILLDEQHREGPLAGVVIWISRQAEVVILLRRLHVGGAREELGLLVVGGTEVVEAIGAAGLLCQRLLEMVHSSQVVPLLIEPHPLGVVVAAHPAAPRAGHQREERHPVQPAVKHAGRKRLWHG